jgi:hypothetical protein
MNLASFDALIFFLGLVLELGVIWLLLAQMRLTLLGSNHPSLAMSALTRSALGLLLLAFVLQLAAAFLPSWNIASGWFIGAAAFSLIPAWLLHLSLRPRAAQPISAPSVSGPTGEPSRQAAQDLERRVEKVQQVIAAHPEGVTLVQVGAALGIEWRQLTGVARELLKRGLVQKDGKIYRPRSGG